MTAQRTLRYLLKKEMPFLEKEKRQAVRVEMRGQEKKENMKPRTAHGFCKAP